MGARAKSGRVYFKFDHMFLTFGLMVNVTDIVEKQFLLWYFEHAYLGNCTSNLFLRKIGQYTQYALRQTADLNQLGN